MRSTLLGLAAVLVVVALCLLTHYAPRAEWPPGNLSVTAAALAPDVGPAQFAVLSECLCSDCRAAWLATHTHGSRPAGTFQVDARRYEHGSRLPDRRLNGIWLARSGPFAL